MSKDRLKIWHEEKFSFDTIIDKFAKLKALKQIVITH